MFTHEPQLVFVFLIFSHFVFDFHLQGLYIATGKNPNTAHAYMPWSYALFEHAYLHAVGVIFVTGSVVLGALELVAHYITDYFKCRDKIGFMMDQSIHLMTKVGVFAIWWIWLKN